MIGEKGLKSRTLYEDKRVREGQEEEETDRASVHVHSKGHSQETLHRTHTDVSVYLTWKRDIGSV